MKKPGKRWTNIPSSRPAKAMASGRGSRLFLKKAAA